jgi:hypothetical protein
MMSFQRIAIAAGALLTAVVAAPAMAVVDYAPIGQVASLQGGGEAITKNLLNAEVSILTVDTTVLSLSNLSITARNFEFLATTGKTPALLTTDLLLSAGAANNGTLFFLNYDRALSPSPGAETGIFAVNIIDTDSVFIRNTTPFTQSVDVVFDVELIDFGSAFTSPSNGTFLLHGTSSIATSEISYSYSLIVPGKNGPIIVSSDEPAVLAILAVGMLALGYARRNR